MVGDVGGEVGVKAVGPAQDVVLQVQMEQMAQFGLERNIPKMEEDLKKYGIQYDQWFLESSSFRSSLSTCSWVLPSAMYFFFSSSVVFSHRAPSFS